MSLPVPALRRFKCPEAIHESRPALADILMFSFFLSESHEPYVDMLILGTSHAKSYLRVTFLFLILFFVFRYYLASEKTPASLPSSLNATLGFGALYVLTEDTSTWRVQGLLSAAKLTGLRFTIPVQQRPTDSDISVHLNGDEVATVLDEIRAVLNYISLLETFLRSGRETALFVEDDVDFGIHIKAQMGNISSTILAQTATAEDISAEGDDQPPLFSQYPYGKDAWDVLWIGHFGLEYTTKTKVWDYRDPQALPWDRLTSKFNNYYQQQAGASKDQQILQNVAPMATYAFALTRPAAERLLRILREGKAQKFDLALHIQCKGLDMLCLAPAPGVMHHHKVEGQRSLLSEGTKGDGKHDLGWWRYRHKYTYNVEWSARCNAEHVGERVGDRWQCMPGLVRRQ
ncbi:uncharacterized protein LTR77_006338 [Saxophila tyrrhenica]|uniref:Uncharacterized protein n=1 Tax=Saxophila tyrrhenica TaxID=1690608 RepID=A0AAV9PB26_9PEZI|nr:hypothetical protein LTR77_006338 [Saxophila tyrrhenica]